MKVHFIYKVGRESICLFFIRFTQCWFIKSLEFDIWNNVIFVKKWASEMWFLWQNGIFKMGFLWKIGFWNVIIVKNEILKNAIFVRNGVLKCDFCDKMRFWKCDYCKKRASEKMYFENVKFLKYVILNRWIFGSNVDFCPTVFFILIYRNDLQQFC